MLYVAFCTIMEISQQKESRSRDYALFRITLRVLYSAQYYTQHCTLQAFEQFGTLYMHNHDDKYPADRDLNLVPPGYKPQSIGMSHRAGLSSQDMTISMKSPCRTWTDWAKSDNATEDLHNLIRRNNKNIHDVYMTKHISDGRNRHHRTTVRWCPLYPSAIRFVYFAM